MCIKDPETGKILGPEKRGEVCIRSAMLMKEYHNQPEKTAEVIDADGWFHSGDIGRVDSGGFFYIMGQWINCLVCFGFGLYSHDFQN